MKAYAAILAAAALAALPALAASEHGHHGVIPVKADAAKGAALSEGEVKKVDKAAGKVTIKHGPLANLEMPPMTMVFRVKDKAMLDIVKAGDAIRFKAEKVGGNFTVTEIQPRK